jgi:hypothetical protein
MLKNYKEESSKLSEGHQSRFESKLNLAFSEKKITKKPSFFWLKIAAMVTLFFSLGYLGYKNLSEPQEIIVVEDIEIQKESTRFSLGDISPDLKKIEDFYLTGINHQLASLGKNVENKDLIDGYLSRLRELDTEYAALTIELNKEGPTEETIIALIDNLKLRLELLFKLKNKLKELKNLENEKINKIQA